MGCVWWPGCLQNLEFLSLQSTPSSAQNLDREKLAAVGRFLEVLLRFRLLACSPEYCHHVDTPHLEAAPEAVVNLHRMKWLCVYSQGSERLYERVLVR